MQRIGSGAMIHRKIAIELAAMTGALESVIRRHPADRATKVRAGLFHDAQIIGSQSGHSR